MVPGIALDRLTRRTRPGCGTQPAPAGAHVHAAETASKLLRVQGDFSRYLIAKAEMCG
jgi:hypothetical protein